MSRTAQPKQVEIRLSRQGTQKGPKPIFRFSLGSFLGILILNILISPFVDRLPSGGLIETLLMTLVLLFAVLSIAGGRRALVGVVLVAPAALGEWLNYLRPEMSIYVMTRVAGLLFIGFVVIQLLRFIVYAPRVDSEVLCAAVAGYLLSGLAWSLAYSLLSRLDPNSFAFTLGPESMNVFTGLYFSFVTLSTVGYGDIVPVSSVARMLAIVEAMFGMFYMTLLIARLVSLYSSKSSPEAVDVEKIEDKKRIASQNSQTSSNTPEE
jgi:hypothetical protein